MRASGDFTHKCLHLHGMAALDTRSIGPCEPHFRRFPAPLRLASTCRVPISLFLGRAKFRQPQVSQVPGTCYGINTAKVQRAVSLPTTALSVLSSKMFSRFLTPLALAACTAVSVLPAVSCGPVSVGLSPRTPAGGIDVQALAESLSENAQVYVPSDEPFAALTVRWSNLEPPTPNVVVVAAVEEDVLQTVSSPLSPSASLLHTEQPANTIRNRLPSHTTTVSPFLLTMGTMVLSSR